MDIGGFSDTSQSLPGLGEAGKKVRIAQLVFNFCFLKSICVCVPLLLDQTQEREEETQTQAQTQASPGRQKRERSYG